MTEERAFRLTSEEIEIDLRTRYVLIVGDDLMGCDGVEDGDSTWR